MMENDFASNIRQAHRLIAAYERRVLDTMAFVGDRLRQYGFWPRGWSLAQHAPPPQAKNSDWMNRWVWDYLPLGDVQGWWMRGSEERVAGTMHVLVEHVVDTAIESWRRERNGEPDPLEFAALEQRHGAATVWRARWLYNPPTGAPIPNELWQDYWKDIIPKVFGPGIDPKHIYPIEAKPPFTTTNAELGLIVGVFAVPLEQVSTPDDFKSRFVEPLLHVVRDTIGSNEE